MDPFLNSYYESTCALLLERRRNLLTSRRGSQCAGAAVTWPGFDDVVKAQSVQAETMSRAAQE
jgi:hypothetical protein